MRTAIHLLLTYLLLRRDSLHVTCGLTACTPGSAPGPTLGNEYGKTLPFFIAASLFKINLLTYLLVGRCAERGRAVAVAVWRRGDRLLRRRHAGDHQRRASLRAATDRRQFAANLGRRGHQRDHRGGGGGVDARGCRRRADATRSQPRSCQVHRQRRSDTNTHTLSSSSSARGVYAL